MPTGTYTTTYKSDVLSNWGSHEYEGTRAQQSEKEGTIVGRESDNDVLPRPILKMSSQKYGWCGVIATAGMLSHRVCTITTYFDIA